MHRRTVMAGVGMVAVLLAGCTQVKPYRTKHLTSSSGTVTIDEAKCQSQAPANDSMSCQNAAEHGRHAIQHRQYQYNKTPGEGQNLSKADYYLAFVEFDDQGWFIEPRQMQALFLLLNRIERGQTGRQAVADHPLIILYVHGWKHNASECDDNVICFSRLLERMDILERHRREMTPDAGAASSKPQPPRPVVGVYVGWRGLSLDAGLLTNVTFWTRKAAAERVGRGGVKELLTRLNDYRAARNLDRKGDQTQLVIAGHSFGGLVVYSAISHSLVERAAHIGRFDAKHCRDIGPKTKKKPDGLACYDTATSFGDFVVLVNPAFEGSVYEPLYHVATNRCYRDTQRPVLMTVTSEGDWATGKTFPLGRRASTLFELIGARSPAQRKSVVTAVGHDIRYQTHELKWVENQRAREPGPKQGCDCPHLKPTTDFNWKSFAKQVKRSQPPPVGSQTHETRAPALKAEHQENKRIYADYGPGVRLEGDMKYNANFPYLMVKADREIIADHNAIYSEPFVKFLHAFFLLHIAAKKPFEAGDCARDAQVQDCHVGGLLPCEASYHRDRARPSSP